MIQLIGKTYRPSQDTSIHVALVQSEESGREWWEVRRTVYECGTSFTAHEKHGTRTEAMRVVRRAFHHADDLHPWQWEG